MFRLLQMVQCRYFHTPSCRAVQQPSAKRVWQLENRWLTLSVSVWRNLHLLSLVRPAIFLKALVIMPWSCSAIISLSWSKWRVPLVSQFKEFLLSIHSLESSYSKYLAHWSSAHSLRLLFQNFLLYFIQPFLAVLVAGIFSVSLSSARQSCPKCWARLVMEVFLLALPVWCSWIIAICGFKELLRYCAVLTIVALCRWFISDSPNPPYLLGIQSLERHWFLYLTRWSVRIFLFFFM